MARDISEDEESGTGSVTRLLLAGDANISHGANPRSDESWHSNASENDREAAVHDE